MLVADKGRKIREKVGIATWLSKIDRWAVRISWAWMEWIWGTLTASSVVKALLSNGRCMGLIPGGGARIPHTSQPNNQNTKQKQYCTKFNRLKTKKKSGPCFKKKLNKNEEKLQNFWDQVHSFTLEWSWQKNLSKSCKLKCISAVNSVLTISTTHLFSLGWSHCGIVDMDYFQKYPF